MIKPASSKNINKVFIHYEYKPLYPFAIRNSLLLLSLMFVLNSFAQMKMEYLTRGLVAVQEDEKVFLSWRIFVSDTKDVSYNIFRNDELITKIPVTGVSNFVDNNGGSEDLYRIEAIKNNTIIDKSDPVKVWAQNYLTIPLKTPEGYEPNDASVADLDGDGELEIVIKMEGRTHDNSHDGYTDPVFLHAYELDGTLLWEINLGMNIRGGAHYTQFMVYDLDGDGFAEVACKTAPGTKDGKGKFLNKGPAQNDIDTTDYRNEKGHIIAGPEYLTVFDGDTGEELSTVNYIPTLSNPHEISTWGDPRGNRSERYLAAVAYFDQLPSLVMCRGYYDRTTLTAWDLKKGELVKRWAFDTEDAPDNMKTYEGQGNHSICVADVDNDDKQEIIYGAMALDDDGTPLWTTGLGHGDAMHVSDIDINRPGLEKWGIHEGRGPGSALLDAATGEVLWITENGDVGRGVSADLDSTFAGMECWGGTDGLRSANNQHVGDNPSSSNFLVWWDGDLLRELLNSNTISKYGGETLLTAEGCQSNNGSKSTPTLSGDILGDWREEVIWRTSDNQSLRLYTTTIPSNYGIYTLLQDPQYRIALTWQNVAYNQPPHPGFFIGHNMKPPSKPNIAICKPEKR